MISTEDIKNVTFKKSGFGGYKPVEVDSFIDNVQKSYEILQQENMKLKLRVEELNKQLKKYQEEESCIRSAILSAQKLADASLLDADNKANSVLLKASKEADEIVKKAKAEVEKQKELLWKMNIKSQKFQSKLIRIYEDQLSEVKKILEDNNEDIFEKTKNFDTNESNCVTDEQNKDILSVEFNKHEENDVLPVGEIGEVENKMSNIESGAILEDISSGSDIEDISSKSMTKKVKLKNLKFGSKYRAGGHEFGKGLYAGLFRRKK